MGKSEARERFKSAVASATEGAVASVDGPPSGSGDGLTLKRGRGLCFGGENWRLAGEDRWEEHKSYVPSGREQFYGTRQIRGAAHAVFRCADGDFLAQPSEICELPVPGDPLVVLSLSPEEVAEEERFELPVV